MNQEYALGQFLRNRYMEGKPYELLHEFYDRHQVSFVKQSNLYFWSDLFNLFFLPKCVCNSYKNIYSSENKIQWFSVPCGIVYS